MIDVKIKYVFILIITSWSCTNPESINNRFFNLKEVAVYGDSVLNSADKYGGDWFAKINAITVSDDSRLFVLDSDYKKVTAFDSLGNHTGNIVGGYGRGPGEFDLPNALYIDKDGILSVYDFNNRKIAFFSSFSGEVLGERLIPTGSRSIITTEDRMYIAHQYSTLMRITIFDKAEGNGVPYHNISPREIEFAGGGITTFLNRTRDGSILVASNIPGIWYEITDSLSFNKKGKDLLPGSVARVYPNDGLTVYPAATIGIGKIDKYTAIVWQKMILNSDDYSIDGFYLSLMNEQNEEVDRIKFPHQWIQYVDFDALGNIYIAVNQPYYHVIKYRLEAIDGN